MEYALRYPERLSHLILFDTTPGGDYWEEVKANARRKGATPEQLDALEVSADNEEEFWRLFKLIEPLYFHTYVADLAERVLGRTIFSVEAAQTGDAIQEGWDLTPRLSEIFAPRLILVGRDDFICPPPKRRACTSSSSTRSWWFSREAAISRTWRNRMPSSMRSVGGSGVPNEKPIHPSA